MNNGHATHALSPFSRCDRFIAWGVSSANLNDTVSQMKESNIDYMSSELEKTAHLLQPGTDDITCMQIVDVMWLPRDWFLLVQNALH